MIFTQRQLPLQLAIVRALHEQPPTHTRVTVDHRRRAGGYVGRRGGEGHRLVPESPSHHRHELGMTLEALDGHDE